MTDALIREVAEQIVREQILLNWRFWLIAVALLAVATAASAFLASYFTRRGQNLADRADLEGILEQLRATTDAAERVRVEISHADWSAKEWKTIRRVKLEEFYNLLYETQHWVETLRDIKVFGNNKPELPDPQPRLELLSRLYFPELLTDVLAFRLTTSEMKVHVASAVSSMHESDADQSKKLKAIAVFREQWTPLYKQALQQASALEKKAPDIIKEIVGA